MMVIIQQWVIQFNMILATGFEEMMQSSLRVPGVHFFDLPYPNNGLTTSKERVNK